MWCWLWIPDILTKLPSNFCRKKNESCEQKLLMKNFSNFKKYPFFKICDQHWIFLIKSKKQRKKPCQTRNLRNSLFIFKENYYIMYYKHADEQYVKTKRIKKSYSPLSLNNFSNSSSALVKSSSVSAAPPALATRAGSSLSVKVFKSTVRP